jgi:hypothetical protein
LLFGNARGVLRVRCLVTALLRSDEHYCDNF